MGAYCGQQETDSMAQEGVTSLKSVGSEGTETTSRISLRPTTSGRRFSNISNLAFDMSSTATSAPRLQGCGSLELGFVLEDGASQISAKNVPRPVFSQVRRTLSALEQCSGSPSVPSSTASAPQYVEHFL